MRTSRQGSRRPGLWGGVAALLCWTAANGGEPVPGAKADADSTLVLAGVIDQAMLEHFNAAIAEREIRTVLISSHEGQPDHALQIAEAILAGNMDVVVRTVCVGACAQHILAAGRNRRVEDGALVAFQLTATGLASIGELLGEDAPTDFQPVLKRIQDLAAREEHLYRQRGISHSLLLEASVALQPQCVIFRRGPGGELTGLSLSPMTYSLWVPTKRQLNSAGLDIDGFWPGSRRQLVRTATRIMAQEKQAQRLRFGDEDHLRRRRDGKYEFRDLKKCALEEERTVEPGTADIPPQHPPPGAD